MKSRANKAHQSDDEGDEISQDAANVSNSTVAKSEVMS